MRTNTILLAVAWYISTTGSAYAYLDPGTGSILLQGLIGGIASGLFVIRMYWAKLRSMIGLGTQRDTDLIELSDTSK